MADRTMENESRELSLYQAIANHANAVIGAKDLEGRYLFVNEEYSRLFGVAARDFIGKTDYDLFPKEIARAFREADLQVQTGGRVLHIEEKAIVNGETRYYQSAKFPIFDEEGTLFATGVVATDITELKMSQARVLDMARHDSLTKLYNRAYFYERLEEALKSSERRHLKLALMFVDLDKFKQVNDTHGHHVGDKLLRDVANVFRRTVRETDLIGRLGGDEFGILLMHPENRTQVERIAKRIVEEVQTSVLVEGQSGVIGASIGISIFEGERIESDEFIRYADLAMYEVKKSGRNNFRFYETRH